MAQQHGLNFKDIITSFGINQKDFAIAPSGVYAGFDEIQETPSGTPQPQMNQRIIQFAHTQTAARYVNQDGTVSLLSCVKGPHGDIVTESASILLPITLNPSQNRIDAVVLRHSHATVQGGGIADYEVIEGVEGDTNPPTIPLSNERTVIGYLLVRPLAVGVEGMEWLRSETPKFGGVDFRDNGLAMRSMLSLRENATELTVNNHIVQLPFDVNIYTVKARDLEAQNTVYYLPTKKDKVFGEKKIGGVIWLSVKSDSFATKLTMYDVANMSDIGITVAPDGYKFIKTGKGSEIIVTQGGVIQLVERVDYWEVVGVQDSLTHPFTLREKLDSKGIWWLETGFVSSVRSAIIQTLVAHGRQTANVINGLIQIGATAAQRNIVEIDVPQGVDEILGVSSPFMFTDTEVANCTEVILKFDTVAEGKAILRLGTGANNFKSANGFDFVVKSGSVVKCLQTFDGLIVIEGEPFIKWVKPSNANGQFDDVANGVEYAVYPDGFIRFKGSLTIKAAIMRKVFSLPAVFNTANFQNGLLRAMAVPKADASGLHSLRYGNLDGEGWGIYSDNGTEAVGVCMEGVYISY